MVLTVPATCGCVISSLQGTWCKQPLYLARGIMGQELWKGSSGEGSWPVSEAAAGDPLPNGLFAHRCGPWTFLCLHRRPVLQGLFMWRGLPHNMAARSSESKGPASCRGKLQGIL